jgi:hypothetical protein
MGALQKQIVLDSPAFLWTLDELSGTTARDTSGNGRHDTYNGSPSLASKLIIPGLPKCWDPDASNDYINLAYDAALAPGTGDFLIEFWVNGLFVNTTSRYESYFIRDLGITGNGIDVYSEAPNTGNAGTMRVWCGGSVLSGTKRINDGVLHHVWIERRSGTLSTYVDNALDVSAARAANANGSGTPSIFAGSDTGSSAFTDAAFGYLAYYVGTIPSATRRTVHYQTALREAGVV